MASVVDQDHTTLERWSAWQDAEIAVVWDGHLGGWPVCLVGIESKPLKRVGLIPADGPDPLPPAADGANCKPNWTLGSPAMNWHLRCKNMPRRLLP